MVSAGPIAQNLAFARAAITNFEIGISTPQVRVMEALVAAFEQAGMIFLDADDNGGPRNPA